MRIASFPVSGLLGSISVAAFQPGLCSAAAIGAPDPGEASVSRLADAGSGHKVGIVGIGGLGHMGVKLAHALGATVVAFTTSPSKREEALRLGADEVVISRDAAEMAAHTGSFDFILNTVAAPHDLDPFVTLLKRDGTLTLVGVPAEPHPSPAVFNLVFGRRSIAGSLIGGIAETQEMLDFCAEHGITAEIEIIAMDEIDEAYRRTTASDVKYRFVIDMATLDAAA